VQIFYAYLSNHSDDIGVYGSTSKRLMPEGPSMVGGAWWPYSERPWFERFGDLVIACGLIAFFLPLMIVVAIAIKCDSSGPVLIWEQRAGRHGRQFWALKFRTMHGSGAYFYDEPEATFVGGIIHPLRLDTLPQLVNVLRGEMTCLRFDPGLRFFLE
jgi:lipopolysaccharide/colanic/teichoic acid biosynthesis glycosyltransferase